jgi:hypothetical protein
MNGAFQNAAPRPIPQPALHKKPSVPQSAPAHMEPIVETRTHTNMPPKSSRGPQRPNPKQVGKKQGAPPPDL